MKRLSILAACSLLCLAGCNNGQDVTTNETSSTETTAVVSNMDIEHVEIETETDALFESEATETEEETEIAETTGQLVEQTTEPLSQDESTDVPTEEPEIINDEVSKSNVIEESEPDVIGESVDSEWHIISDDGQQITLNLKYTAGTPYVWTHRVDNSDVISIIDDSYNLDYVSDNPMIQRVGGENTYTATFEAKKAGTAVIEMIYTRCDDNGEPTDILRSCFIKVSVDSDLKISIVQSGQEENGIGTVSDWKY